MIGFLAGLLAAALVMAAAVLAAGGLAYLLGLLACGLVAGALVRVAAPGAHPIGYGITLLAGTGGSVLCGFVGWFLFEPRSRYLGFVLAAAGAAFVVWLLSHQRPVRAA